MGWSHPDISLDDLMRHVRGFIDILILASGYQSSGAPAIWDADNIEKSLRWGLFFEQVIKRLDDSTDYEGSVKELNAALLDLTSNPLFPQGLTNMSCETLFRARNLILGHLLQTHPLKGEHLVALLTAVIKMDIHDLSERDNSSEDMYLRILLTEMESLHLIPVGRSFIEGSSTSSTINDSMSRVQEKHRPPSRSYVEPKDYTFVCHSCFAIQEILTRQGTMSCVSSVETELATLLEIFTRNCLIGTTNRTLQGQPPIGNLLREEILTEVFLWNKWKSKCLSYLLNKRTIRLLSGATLIFESPKNKWIRVFEPLKTSLDERNDNLLEIMEISLLGFNAGRWDTLIEYLMSHSFNVLTILQRYSDLHNFLQGIPQSFHSEKEAMNTKEKDILQYVTELLVTQPHILWQLPPVLSATIPSWSTLFRMYLSEIERQLTGASLIRCCGCYEEEKDHKDCEVAERIRCLHMFHIRGPYPMVDNSTV